MAQADRLFKPFTRLHRQDEFIGYGLGLATVHRIVKRHGGDIEAEATIGQGTTIRFWLKTWRRTETVLRAERCDDDVDLLDTAHIWPREIVESRAKS